MGCRKRIIGMLSALFLAIFQTAVMGAPVIRLTADSAAPTLGSVFSVTLNITGAAPFSTWGEFIRFDSAKVELVSQAGGTFATFVPDSRDSAGIYTSGEIRAAGFSFTDNADGAGTLGVFRFRAIAPGEAIFTTRSKSDSCPFGDILKAKNGSSELPGIEGSLGITIQSLSTGLENSGSDYVTALDEISPNPCNPVMRLAYQVSAADSRFPVCLKVYDSRGQLVKVLADGMRAAGSYVVSWNTAGHPSGIYVARYECGRYTAIRKGMLVK